MTAATIQHILTGLKGEIAREKDRERVQALCIMGMHWGVQLIINEPEPLTEPVLDWPYKICQDCELLTPLNEFSSFIKRGKLCYRPECKKCTAARCRVLRKFHKRKGISIAMWKEC